MAVAKKQVIYKGQEHGLNTIPCFQIRYDSLIFYQEYINRKKPSNTERDRLLSQMRKVDTYSGKVTNHARKRLTKAVDLLLQIASKRKIYNPIIQKEVYHRLSFITLTIHTDIDGANSKATYIKLLKPFLRIMREQWQVNTYIWKAELQKRGAIHYHITTPSFINHSLIRKAWNKLLQQNGYLEEYHSEKGHYDAPSTEIKSVYKKGELANYLGKEICKAIQNETPLSGKVWDCSTNLKECKFFTTELNDTLAMRVVELHSQGLAKVIDTERCSIVKLKAAKATYVLDKERKEQYLQHIEQIKRKVFDAVLLYHITATIVLPSRQTVTQLLKFVCAATAILAVAVRA